jgi:Arc/MetJ-type ribon-helix-helix transcriptional regulator
MGQSHIQTRVPDELYERIEEYEESNEYMNQAEAVRALLRAGLEAEESDEPDEYKKAMREAEHEESDQLLSLARLLEKTAALTVIAGALSLIVPILAGVAVTTFGLTVGTFGAYLIWGFAGLAIVVSLLVGVPTIIATGYLVAAHGIEQGWFGRHFGTALTDGEVTA